MTSSSCLRRYAGCIRLTSSTSAAVPGRVLDLGLATPERYAGVDSSQAMLNLLFRKHPKVAAVYPVDVREALSAGTFTPRQFDWVFRRAHGERSCARGAGPRLALTTVGRDDWKAHHIGAVGSVTAI